jgi:rhamnogalacturonan acetylesterase
MNPSIQFRFGSRVALMLAMTFACSGFTSAQTAGVPGPNLPVPDQTGVTQNAPLNPTLPTIFIVGDSTARNKADLGWGDHLAHYFDTTKVNVANRAIAGRSARSYMNEGAWDRVLAEMKAGDYVLLQWGHNDGGGPLTPTFNARGEGKGIGDESVDIPVARPFTVGPLAGKTTETVHTYGWYNRKYIADTRAKGATPLLLTVTIRDIWTPAADGTLHIEPDMGYRDYDMQIAAAEHVPLIDMATVEMDKLEMLGPYVTRLLFPIDHTHTSPVGAEMNAGSVVTALKNANSPLVKYLAPLKAPTYGK